MDAIRRDICMPAPLQNIRCLLRKNIAWSLINGTYDRLTAVTYGDMANS